MCVYVGAGRSRVLCYDRRSRPLCLGIKHPSEAYDDTSYAQTLQRDSVYLSFTMFCNVLSRVLVTKTGFGLVIGFINCLQLQTITCNTSCYTNYNNLLLTTINTAIPLFTVHRLACTRFSVSLVFS
jgi:hypothetical protein